MADLNAGGAPETWTVQVLEVGKGHPPGRYLTDGSHAENFPASSCVTGRQEAGAYCLGTLLAWVVALAGHFCCPLRQPCCVFRPVLLHVLIKHVGGLLR